MAVHSLEAPEIMRKLVTMMNVLLQTYSSIPSISTSVGDLEHWYFSCVLARDCHRLLVG
jgi:hypothetical protein